jgi:hypothetical protein
MPEATAIQNYARKECIYGLATVEADHGKAVANQVADGNLQAIAFYLTGSIGAEAAYAVMTRHADEIIRPVIDARVTHR